MWLILLAKFCESEVANSGRRMIQHREMCRVSSFLPRPHLRFTLDDNDPLPGIANLVVPCMHGEYRRHSDDHDHACRTGATRGRGRWHVRLDSSEHHGTRVGDQYMLKDFAFEIDRYAHIRTATAATI